MIHFNFRAKIPDLLFYRISMFHSCERFRPTPIKPTSGWKCSNSSSTANWSSFTARIQMVVHSWVAFKRKRKIWMKRMTRRSRCRSLFLFRNCAEKFSRHDTQPLFTTRYYQILSVFVLVFVDHHYTIS